MKPMGEKQEKKRRYNLRLEFIANFAEWLKSEPPMWMFWRWRKWKKNRPVWDSKKGVLWDYDYGIWG